jgi:Xaa-Pro aminopeptidase
MMPKEANMMLLTTLDDIAWLLNLRGNDIEFNPLFFSYVILHKIGENFKIDLFINKDKVSDQEVSKYLSDNNVTVYNYTDVEAKIKDYSALEKKNIVVDVGQCSYRLFSVLKENSFEISEKNGTCENLKACKNKIQQDGMRNANIRDCAAIMKYFAFLEEELQKPDHGINEFSGARKVEEYRTFGDKYVGPSFDTISSIGANGAVIHYKPKIDSAMSLNPDEIYLLDSGGQYLDGTTDITRCGHFGGKAPTPF